MTADTSVIVAALASWHEHHDAAAQSLADVRSVPAHALTETYSVLTRLPGGLAVDATIAAELLRERFPGPLLRLSGAAQRRLTDTLAAAGVFGGSSYDGLIGLEAASADLPLLTLDQRAVRTYQRLGVAYVPLTT